MTPAIPKRAKSHPFRKLRSRLQTILNVPVGESRSWQGFSLRPWWNSLISLGREAVACLNDEMQHGSEEAERKLNGAGAFIEPCVVLSPKRKLHI